MKFLLQGMVVSLLAMVTLTGCMGYRVGSNVAPELRSVYVAAFENATVYPMVGAVTTQHLMTAIVEDGTFNLDPLETATLRITGRVESISNDPISYDHSNFVLPKEYLCTIKATYYVYNTQTGEMMVNGKSVEASEYMLTRGEMQTAVVDIIPSIAAKLGDALLDQLHNLEANPLLPKAPAAEAPASETTTPEAPEAPAVPEVTALETPVAPEVEAPAAPEVTAPEAPAAPEVVAPEVEIPAAPVAPETPATPEVIAPEVETPAAPAVPEAPAPAAPAAPAPEVPVEAEALLGVE